VAVTQTGEDLGSLDTESGGALQLHPGLAALDPTLAFRDFQLLKPKHDEPLSKFAFQLQPVPLHRGFALPPNQAEVGRCRLTPG